MVLRGLSTVVVLVASAECSCRRVCLVLDYMYSMLERLVKKDDNVRETRGFLFRVKDRAQEHSTTRRSQYLPPYTHTHQDI